MENNVMNNKGYIYIMTYDVDTLQFVKIGYAKDVEERHRQLSSETMLVGTLSIYATYETNVYAADKSVHKLIDMLNPDLRKKSNREFYRMSPEDAYKVLGFMAVATGTQDKLVKWSQPVHTPVVNTSAKSSVVTNRKPNINFRKCGIPVGATLEYVGDPSVTVTVTSEYSVEFEGQETSVTAVARKLTGKQCSGTSYFSYNGKLLYEIGNETQWKDWFLTDSSVENN